MSYPKQYRLLCLIVYLLAGHLISYSQHNNNPPSMQKIRSRTVVFITGAYVSHTCWDNWRVYFESKGYTTIAPPWPGKDADAATLRARHPDSNLAKVSLPEILDYYKGIISRLPEQPILIGHSYGGLMVQLLLNQGYGDAAVAIHAVPPKGVLPLAWNFLRSNTAALGFFTSLRKTYMMPFKKWQFAFTNGMSEDIQRSSYQQLAIPESKRAVRGGLTKTAKVDFKKEHNPLLIIAGAQDHCIPPSLCRKTFKKYKNKKSVIDFRIKDRNHFVLGLPTWKEDAGYISDWIDEHR